MSARRLVEIGHSERRTHFGETDETVALKIEGGARTMACWRWSASATRRQEYEAGQTSAVLARQVRARFLSVAAARTATASSSPMSRSGRSAKAAFPPIPTFADRQHALIKEESLTGFRRAGRRRLRRQRQSGQLPRARDTPTYRRPVHRPLGLGGAGLYRHRRKRDRGACRLSERFAPFLPLCGRRWPDEVGSDEGLEARRPPFEGGRGGNKAVHAEPPLIRRCAPPSPAKREKGFLARPRRIR